MSDDMAEQLAVSRNFLTLDDVALLKRVATMLPNGARVADIGVGSGTTALAILEAHPDAQVWSFDISQDNLNWAEEAIRNCRFLDRWTRHCEAGAPVAGVFTDGVFDAVLLDASHTYQDTRSELAAWGGKVKPGGWLWCHDYAGDGGVDSNGVRQAVNEYMMEHGKAWTGGIEQGLGIAFQRKRGRA